MIAGVLGLCGACSGGSSDASPCHEMRKCVTLTCREHLSKGRSSEKWKRCVEWCRTSRGTPKGTHALCAESIGVTCIRNWYGAACVQARQRCETGRYREKPERC